MRKYWNTSILETIEIFRESLLVLVPVVERAKIPWRNPDNYDDWDEIASTLFQSIVIGSIKSSAKGRNCSEIIGYDVRVSNYKGICFVGTPGGKYHYAFVCFQTNKKPFDECLFARVDENGDVIGMVTEEFGNRKMYIIDPQKDSVIADKIRVEL